MSKVLKNMYIAIGLLLVSIVPAALVVSPALADTKSSVCQGVNIASGTPGTNCSTGSGTTIDKLVKQIITIFSWVVGVVAVFAIIAAGLQFIIAGGDAAKIAKARNVILYAIVGLIVVAVAQLIVFFVLGNVNKAI